MTREQEIKEILKSLLRRANEAIDNNYYTDDIGKIVKSSEKLSDITKEVDKYLIELKEIEQSNFVHGDK